MKFFGMGMNFLGNSNSVTIIKNGKVIKMSEEGGDKRTFDETRTEKAADIDSISVDALNADVTVMVKNTSDVTVHFSGWASVLSGDVRFDTKVVNRELRVKLNIKGNVMGGNFKINITVPSEKIFQDFTFASQSADLEILGRLISKSFSVQTMSGDVSGEMELEKAAIKTMSGDIDLDVFAREEHTIFKANSMSGDISARLHNFGNITFMPNTMNGDIKNNFKQSSDGYTASIEISTMSGDIKIK